jgi:hypothetical protein
MEHASRPGSVFISSAWKESEPELEPVGIEDHLHGEDDEQDEEDQPAAASSTGCAAAETKTLLKPIKEHIQHQQFKQTTQTALPFVHKSTPLLAHL